MRVEERLLMGPGPSNVDHSVLAAMGSPTIGHLDPEFLAIMNDTMGLLRRLLGTDNNLTFPVSGTGSSGMEASIVNFIERGDRVVICVAGVFGERLADTARRVGADVTRVEVEWGRTADPDLVCQAMDKGPVKALVVVHAETSTGARQSLEPLAEIARGHDALFIVDAVTSLGGLPVDVDRIGIDVCYSGTQKCLSCPPGLSPLTVGERGLAALDARTSPVPSWYLDLTMIRQYWGSERLYHHTAPINMVYALHQAATLILDEGLDSVFARHRENMAALTAGLGVYGLQPIQPEEERLASLAVVRIPDGIDDPAVRGALLAHHRIEIGGGLGPLKGKVWRIGLMGHTSRRHNVTRFVSALGGVLNRMGRPVDVTGALAAVEGTYR